MKLKDKLIVMTFCVALVSVMFIVMYNHFDKPVEFDCVSYYESINADVSKCY